VRVRGDRDLFGRMAATARRRLTNWQTEDAMNGFPLFRHPPVRSVRWWMFDALITALVGLCSLPYLLDAHVTPLPAAIGVQAALTVPLVLRRVAPSAVFAGIFVGSAVAGLWNPQLVIGFALIAALYAVAAHQSPQRALVAAGLVEGGLLVAAIRLAGSGWWQEATLGTGMIAAAVGLGLYAATRRAYLQELHNRAERLERERDQQQELAAAAERARINREMHDIVAHHLAVMIALSQGAAAAASRTCPTAAEAMRAVSATGRQALADTRRLLNGPADDAEQDGTRQPLPDLGGLDSLIGTVRAAGLPVSYELHGSPGSLSSAVQLAVYRLVQESLTNTLKHAGAGASAVVRLSYSQGEVRVDVEDDGAGISAAAPGSTGRGLTGMRQRVHAFGGDIQAGPRSPTGWRVSARLRLDQPVPDQGVLT
jgi:signal transduction histidine kinase